MQIAQFINAANVDMSLVANSQAEAVEQLAHLLQQNGYLNNLPEYLEAVAERESHCTTGIGNGVAIPHGKSLAVKQSTIAVARLTQAVDWQAMDDEPVQLVFLLAIQESDASDLHLKLLQQIAVKLMDDTIVAALKAASNYEQLIEAINMEAEEL